MFTFLAYVGAYFIVAIGVLFTYVSILRTRRMMLTAMSSPEQFANWVQAFSGRYIFAGMWPIMVPLLIIASVRAALRKSA